MLCINCKKEMKHKCETRRLLDFSGTAEDEELLIIVLLYILVLVT